MAAKRTKQVVWICILTVTLLIGAASVFAFSFGKYEKVKVSSGVVAIPVTKLADGKVHFYKLPDGGKEIAFFAVKAADGSYKTAFDACDSCYRERKGYEQQGDKLNCKNCNKKFLVSRLGPNATGGCNPGYLPHQLNGSVISINVSDLKAGASYF